MDKIAKRIFSRVFFVGVAILVQVVWIILSVVFLGSRLPFMTILVEAVSLLAVLWLVNKDINPAYKLAWTILILAVPIAGAVIYFMFGKSRLAKDLNEKLEAARQETGEFLGEKPEVMRKLEELDPEAARQSRYICRYAGFPAYQKTETRYFRVGEELYLAMIEELNKAEHFIFLEYFIIDDGIMWQGILDILEYKVRMGVDVRLIYDDVGCVNTLPANFYLQLRKRGIQCEVFNPFLPIASVVLNNRDHRKIMVIDGHTGYTGGINLADEYINEIVRFGYWKDTGVRLKGEAVWSFTVMFLEMWNAFRREDTDIERFRPHVWHPEPFGGTGLVQPYTDSPLDSETIAENVYLDILNQARDYVYIFTPYLIVDDVMRNALCQAAKRGVDVRIVTPGIPDKPTIFRLTRSNFPPLLRAGIRIYEYTPGFIHAKSYISDDIFGVVGSVNMDFRSLYLHFECATLLYRTEGLKELKEDSLRTIRQSRQITLDDCKKGLIGGLVDSVLRVFAPLC